MRVEINLGTHPYEDSHQFWVRWGGGLAALSVVSLLLLAYTVMGWMNASKDREIMHQYETQDRHARPGTIERAGDAEFTAEQQHSRPLRVSK